VRIIFCDCICLFAGKAAWVNSQVNFENFRSGEKECTYEVSMVLGIICGPCPSQNFLLTFILTQGMGKITTNPLTELG